MGCCESRDTKHKNHIPKEPLANNIKQGLLSDEPLFKTLRRLNDIPEIFLTLKKIERLNSSEQPATLHDSTTCKLESFKNITNCNDLPIFKFSFNFNSYVPFQTIADSILSFTARKKWDKNLKNLDCRGSIVTSVFEYSIYTAEFKEEAFQFVYDCGIGILLKSLPGYEMSEKNLKPVNSFTFYNVKEEQEKTVIEVFLKIDMRTNTLLLFQDIISENLLVWGQCFSRHLTQSK